jgi:(p)ppGpp synthase/HD superfamily hydrolase
MTDQPGGHLWQGAASFAARAHEGEVRKDGKTPYAAHPFRVAMTLRQVFGCDDEVCIAAALLHDTIEDSGVDYDDIEAGYGTAVADVVAAMSKDMRMREDRREVLYDEQLAAAGWRAALVKLADVYDNLSDAGTRIDSPVYSKLTARCERAVVIAQQHKAEHSVIARGIEAVEGLCGAVRREQAR